MRGEIVRVSVSSQPSTSSQGSGQDDYDTLGYVFMWGEGIGNGLLGGGMHKLGSITGTKLDALFPKAVGSSVVLDAQQISCGSKHAALVTRQGEIFSWGEESGGWLGHGINADVPYPKLVDALNSCTIEFAACGEYHTCAVTQSGEVYSWGDGAHKFGLLGHGRDISHWMPKRICGSLEGIRISSVSCGPWHTVLVTTLGQLFTFGDGTFGVLGHGDRKSISTPKEIESLKGLKAVRAACGVWHTAAVVEVMVGYSSASNFFSGKLFTWGDGDKGRLGHEDKEERLVPTCVSALIDYNFRQIACGHSLTVALTTSGHVYTIGSAVYGQLGEPRADGRTPVRVEGKLWDAVVEEIACGAHHVAVLTSKSEVYTWGKGANGRLGHGDVEDKKSPALVEALKDRQVKSIACGSSFTAAICLHKWGAGSEQPLCASCRQPFNFTRKRHKCYNCGIVICHSCSARKAYRALMAPNPNKAYRVCDSCHSKLSQLSGQSGPVGKAAKKPWQDVSHERVDRPKAETKLVSVNSQSSLFPGGYVDVNGHWRQGKKSDSSGHVIPGPAGLLTWSSTGIMLPFESANDLMLHASTFQSKRGSPKRGSRSVSPFSRRASPPRSTTPTPTIKGLVSPRVIVDDLRKTNDALSQEVLKLRTQIDNMARQHHQRELDLQRKVNEALALVTGESEKCKAAKEVIKSLTGQLKALAEKFPDAKENTRLPTHEACDFPPSAIQSPLVQEELHLVVNSSSSPRVDSMVNSKLEHGPIGNGATKHIAPDRVAPLLSVAGEQTVFGLTGSCGTTGGIKQEDGSSMNKSEQGTAAEWVDQDELGVYVTLVVLPNGSRDLRRVRFSRRRFTEKQAELWWTENRARVFEKYNVKSMDKSTIFEARTGRE
ncbi:hypothetical protein GOP47_0008016 [Adiantum capillus-veneris]|uniref:Uncharacterized protein n=1 Tax=Adiantum capillus-veneris TaxID=13818 RepID=A0A9D4V3B9_ADICA|nr:hypothetical protein GOP47_0008016 [Adiantum capillus-veneris]